MSELAWITCRVKPEPDPDEAPALAALRAAGVRVQPLAWDDPAARDPGGFALCVPRSCWNYFEDPAGFLAFLERAAATSRLLNGLGVLRWNLHKGYLAELAGGGVPVVPTAQLARGAQVDVAALAAERGWREVVIKPAVSAGSFCTRRFRLDGARREARATRGSADGADAGAVGERAGTAAAQAFLAGALAERDMLVQPFVPDVALHGERALVWIDGAFSHAVVKHPRFSGDEESVSEALAPEPDELALGEACLERALACAGARASQLLYARVDSVVHEGRRVLSELELLEPSLFLLQSPAGMRRFVEAVAGRLG